MIYIVRHGQTDWNVEKRYMGWCDIPLNEKGLDQAQKTSELLKDIKFDYVFSSPLKRALMTAKTITNKRIKKDERIKERCNGQLEGKLKSETEGMIDFTSLEDNEIGVENLNHFRERIYNFLDDIKANYKGKNVLIVTHAGVSIYMKCYFEGEPKDGNYNNYKLKNCEVLTYEND